MAAGVPPQASLVADLRWSGAPVTLLMVEHEVFESTRHGGFRIRKETVNGTPLICFDNAATIQQPQAVIDRSSYFYVHENSNIRAAHELAATDPCGQARDTVRRCERRRDRLCALCQQAIKMVAHACYGERFARTTRSS
jgi:selenocysteine lyase/cysteine desulfurase